MATEKEEEYLKLSVEDRCVHTNWKARVSGYEQCTKNFKIFEDEKSPEWNKYIGLIKKFVVDSNVMAQEKGLEATLVFMENAGVAGKIVGDVMLGIVNKCLAAPKAKTKEYALQITLMCIEIEKQEIVLEELMKGAEAKNPKIVTACLSTLTQALKEFGPKVLSVKPMMKKIQGFLEDRDKGVRDGGKALVVEMYRWIGQPIKQQLGSLKPVQLTELEVEFNKVSNEKSTPTRYLRSQKRKVEVVSDEAEDEEQDEDSGENIIDADAFLEAVEILSKLPQDFHEKLESKKWLDRKEACEKLESLVQNPKLETGDYGDVVRAMKKIISKDSNVVVVALAAKCIAGLAKGLKKHFQPYASVCLVAIIEKFREKKQNVVLALREAADAVFLSINIEVMLDDITAAFENKNPSVKAEVAAFLARCFAHTPPNQFTKKLIKAYTAPLLKCLNEPDPSVRESSAEALGTLLKLVGEKQLMPFISDLDNMKMAKVKEFSEKAVIHVKASVPKKVQTKRPNTAPSQADNKSNDVKRPNTAAKNLPSKKPAAAVAVAPKVDDDQPKDDNVSSRVDISGQITESLLHELADKDWKIRNEGLKEISNIINDAKYIKSNIGDLPQSLALRLVDSNTKIVQATLGLCESLALAMGPAIKQHIRTLFPGIVQCLGDAKNWVRAAALSCMNSWGDQCGYKEFFEGEIIGDTLKSGSPVLRAELWIWLAQTLPTIPPKQIAREELIACIPHLYSNLEDRNVEVRKNVQEAVLGFMIHLSYESMTRQTEKLKPGSKTTVLAALDKARPNLPMKPLPKKQEEQPKTVKSGGAMKAGKTAPKTKVVGATAKPVSARKKDDDDDKSPLLCTNNLKHQRVLDEQRFRVLRWNFTTPREDFVELLKELMMAANVNKTLMANMFHADFRYHLKAIEALTADLPDNSKALVSNLDLILKWLTLRFFDTNPSVLLKGLDYLQTVFNLLIDENYNIQENEAACFIPYLILKIGDPKDAVRNGVRALFKQIGHVYPVSKLFSYVMEGLKSKNARQRTECLDQLGSLIENYGISVCQPSPSAALKEVAKQIADRDNSVRNAALNCIVQAYFLEGEKVFKLVGKISEKDQSLLDERIKRAAKNKPTKSESNRPLSTVRESSAPVMEDPIEKDYEDHDEEEDEEEQRIETMNDRKMTMRRETMEEKSSQLAETIFKSNEPNFPMPQSQPKTVSGPFGLNLELLQQIEENNPGRIRNPKLLEPDINDLSCIADLRIRAPAVPLTTPSLSPPKLLVPKSSFNSSPTIAKDDRLDLCISAMSNLDLSMAIQAMNSMEKFIKSSQVGHLRSKEDKFINAVCMQLKYLKAYLMHRDGAEVAKGYRTAFMVLLEFYNTSILGQNVTAPQLKEFVDLMIRLLAENELEALNDTEAYIRVINNIVVKIIDHSNHSIIICVLIKLLHDCVESTLSPKYEELTMKCLWKIVKLIPNWAGDLDYDTILLEVHMFLKDYPSSWWKKKGKDGDIPFRTIKTVLHTMTRVKGSTIMSHLTKINNTRESELKDYLLRLVSTVKPDEVGSGMKTVTKSNSQARSQKQLSKFTHQQLSEIFKKIGCKQQMNEGLVQLYDFKQQYPEADVQPFLEKTNQYFQDFIDEHLREIDQARKEQSRKSPATNQYDAAENMASVNARQAEEKNGLDPLQRLEKLRALEAQCRPASANQPKNT